MVAHAKEDLVPFEADERLRLRIAEGILGFEAFNDYLLFGSKELYPFRILQSLDEPTVIFVVVEPGLFFTDYEFEMSSADLKLLNLRDIREAMVLSVLVVPEDPMEMSANLLAPVVVNSDKGIAKQVVLHNSSYSVREPLFVNVASQQAGALCLTH